MIDKKVRDRYWGAVAFFIFFLTTTVQVVYQSAIWPFDLLKFLPTFLGDVIALIFWLGAGPLALSFVFLAPTRLSPFAAKVAAVLACFSAVANPIANNIFNLQRFGDSLPIKLLIGNGVTILGAAVLIYIFIVFIPQIIVTLLKREN